MTLNLEFNSIISEAIFPYTLQFKLWKSVIKIFKSFTFKYEKRKKTQYEKTNFQNVGGINIFLY